MDPGPSLCACNEKHHVLKVVCVHMEYLECVPLVICKCNPAAAQLICRGLFPCAPLSPTLAVNMDVLEFALELFVRMGPNEWAWAATMTKYLNAHGHEFTTVDSLRW